MRTSTKRCWPKTWRTITAGGVKVFLMLFLLSFLMPSTGFSQTIIVDGNPSSIPGEWCDPAVKHVSDKYNVINQDTIFAGNEKDYMFAVPDWHWKLGTAKDKNDIANGAAAIVNSVTYQGQVLTGSTYLVFAGDRISNAGDAQIGFWFFQNCTSPVAGGNFAPEKTVGDILVLADFTNGGAIGSVTVLKWVGTGGNYSESEAFDLVGTAAGIAENNASSYDVPCGWSFYDKTDKQEGVYNTNEFYEGFVDLGQFGPGAACFSCFMLETRSSQEITATLDDFVGGALGGVPTVTVNSESRCEEGAGVTLIATPGTPGTYTYAWTGPNGFTSTQSSITVTDAGEYCVVITNTNGCASEPGCGTVTVNPEPTATAGPDDAKCQTAPSGPTSFTLAGTASNGTSVWTQVGSTGTASASITDPSSPTSTVSVSGLGTVTLRITTTSNATPSCGTAQDEVTLTVNENPTATAGPDDAKCQTAPSGPTSFTLAGTASGGTSAWTQVGSTGTASASVADPSSPTSTVDVSGVGTVTLRITTTSANCGTAQDEVTLTVYPNPTATAGPDDSKCQTAPSGPTSFTLAGTASNGTSNWTQVGSTGTASATIADPSSPTSTVSVAGIGTVTLRITTTSTNCGTAQDEVTLTVTSNPTADAGDDDTQCRTASGTNSFGTNTFTVTGTGSSGDPTWSIAPGGNPDGYTVVIDDPNSLTTDVHISGAAINGGSVTLRLTIASESCGSATDDVILTLNALPLIKTLEGSDFCPNEVTTGSVTLKSSESGVSYQLTKDGSDVQAPKLGDGGDLTWTGLEPGTYAVVGTYLATSCNTTSGPADVIENNVPDVTADDKTVCVGSTVELTGSPAGGTWSGAHVTGSTFDATGLAPGDYTVTYTVENEAGCESSDDATVTVVANPTATAGPDDAKCQTAPSGPTSFTLAGTASGGTSAWTQVGSTGTASATVTDPSSPTSTVSVSGIGTVTLRITTTSESCGTAQDEVTLTVYPNPTATAGPDEVKCQTAPSGPTSFTLAGTASNGTSAWTQVGSTGTASAIVADPSSPTSTVSVSGIGTVTLRITTTSTNCGTAQDEVTLTVNENPTATAGPDDAKCQTAPSGPTSFTLAGTASGGTSAWTQVGSTGTASASIADPSSPTSTVDVSGIGTVTLRITTTSESCGTAQDEVTLTVNANPTPVADDKEVCAGATVELTGTPAGGTWSGDHVTGSTFNAAGVAPGAYVVTYEVTENGCTASDEATVTVIACGETYCSYTQGYYGSTNGQSCDGVTGGMNAVQLIQTALDAGGDIIIGRIAGRSVTFKAEAGTAEKINAMLPGGGPSGMLKYDGDITISGAGSLPATFVSNYLTKKGKISNNLFSQTLVLTMNSRLNSSLLAGFELGYGWLSTQENDGCGEDATVVECSIDNPDAIQSWEIKGSVIDYLSMGGATPTVSSLLDLANDVLAGVKTPGVDGVPSYGDILYMVDLLNNAFDECRTSLGFTDAPQACPDYDAITLSSARKATGVEQTTNQLSVAAYPNPYTDLVKFTIESNTSGQAQLEVVNMIGQRVAMVYNGMIQANKSQVVEYRVPTSAPQNLIYIFRLGGKQVTGKLMKGNR